jgi:hypothetical protein
MAEHEDRKGEEATSPKDLAQIDEELELLGAELGFSRMDQEGEQPKLAYDFASLELGRGFGKAYTEGEFRRGQKAATNVIGETFAAEFVDTRRRSFHGAEAARIIPQAIASLEREGGRLFARRHSAYEWLWMIRRVPLAGLWDRRVEARMRIAMASLALASNSFAAQIPPHGMFAITARRARSLAFLAGCAQVYISLEMAYRVIGKGGTLVIDLTRGEVDNYSQPELRRRLDEYDSRAAREQGWGGLGIHLPELAAITGPQEDPVSRPIALLLRRVRPIQRSAPARERGYVARYAEHFVSLAEAFNLLGHPSGPSASSLNPELTKLLPLLVSYSSLVGSDGIDRSNPQQVGYTVVLGSIDKPNESNIGLALSEALLQVQQLLPAAAVPKSPQALLGDIERLPVSPWRGLPGPVLLPAEGATIVDWHSATLRFIGALRYPKVGGEVANVRARAFEDSVQKAIDSSACSPVDWLRNLIGRHLRAGGRAFGEIDAAASIPESSTHLLVSCKSYPFTADYERGEYSEVRNVDQKLTADFLDWRRFAERLSDNRLGDNYAIPNGAVLVPVVVTPRVMYTSDKDAWTKFFDDEWGLHAVCGVGELLEFLDAWSADTSEQRDWRTPSADGQP